MENNRTEKGKFAAGNKGKPKGAINKATRAYKERVEWVLGMLDETLEADLKAMRAADKVKLWLDLQEFVRPKLQRMNLDLTPADDAVSKIVFEVIRSKPEDRSKKTEVN
jgi:hypothetical protein